MSHGFVFAKTMRTRKHHFYLYGEGAGPKHTFVRHDGDNDDALNGRNNKKMKIKIRFYARFECLPACAICPSSCPYANSSSGGRVDYKLRQDLEQDGIDQMRQEYVDHGIDVPGRSDFIAKTDTFYTTRDANYEYMVGKKLAEFRRRWAEQCTIILQDKSGDTSKKVKPSHLRVTSGYRNPEHNDHVYGDPKKAIKDSTHQYGLAMDVVIIDMNDSAEGGKTEDATLMMEAAKAAFGDDVTGHTYSKPKRGFVHADWRP